MPTLAHDGLVAGLYCAAGEKAPNACSFSDFKIAVAPAASPNSSAQKKISSVAPGTVLFADDFKTIMAGWGAPTADKYVRDGALFIRAAASDVGGDMQTNVGYRRQSAQTRIAVDISQAGTGGVAGAGGLVSWMKDPRDRYQFIVGGGRFRVSRIVDGKETVLVGRTPVASLEAGDVYSARIAVRR